MKFSRLLTTIKSDRYYSYEVMDNKYEYSTTRNKQGGRKKKKQNNSCLFVEQLRCMQRFKQEFAVAVMMLHTLYNNNKKQRIIVTRTSYFIRLQVLDLFLQYAVFQLFTTNIFLDKCTRCIPNYTPRIHFTCCEVPSKINTTPRWCDEGHAVAVTHG